MLFPAGPSGNLDTFAPVTSRLKLIQLPQLIQQIDVRRRNWATRLPASDVVWPLVEKPPLIRQTAADWWPDRAANLILRCPDPFLGLGRCLVRCLALLGLGKLTNEAASDQPSEGLDEEVPRKVTVFSFGPVAHRAVAHHSNKPVFEECEP